MSATITTTSSDNGTPIKRWAVLKNGEKVFIDTQNGDGKKAWYYAGRRQIAPEDIADWQD